jgi:glycosyltransferase involved in cell wall biosynthesis
MQRPLISVTLSAYNVEEYIGDCLQNIINQTLKDIEIICIDDGSTDKTLSILNQYAENESRLTVISKLKNEGLAIARNESLELAKGKYVTFVDGDDLMDLDLLRKAYELAEKDTADMVMWDYVTFINNDEIKGKKATKPTLLREKAKNKEYLLRRPAFTWTKLIRTEKARELGIHFPLRLTRQDIPVHWHLITKLDKISLLPEVLSFYRQQPNATTYQTDRRVFDLLKVMDITQTYLIENNLFQTYQELFFEMQINFMFGMYDKAQKDLKVEALKIIQSTLTPLHWNYINSKAQLRWQAREYFKMSDGSIISAFKYYVWKFTRHCYRVLKK